MSEGLTEETLEDYAIEQALRDMERYISLAKGVADSTPSKATKELVPAIEKWIKAIERTRKPFTKRVEDQRMAARRRDLM
jgi:hypothetical protein